MRTRNLKRRLNRKRMSDPSEKKDVRFSEVSTFLDQQIKSFELAKEKRFLEKSKGNVKIFSHTLHQG
jgi:hypothetical protein